MIVSTMMASSLKGSPRRLSIIIHDPEAAKAQSSTRPKSPGARAGGGLNNTFWTN